MPPLLQQGARLPTHPILNSLNAHTSGAPLSVSPNTAIQSAGTAQDNSSSSSAEADTSHHEVAATAIPVTLPAKSSIDHTVAPEQLAEPPLPGRAHAISYIGQTHTSVTLVSPSIQTHPTKDEQQQMHADSNGEAYCQPNNHGIPNTALTSESAVILSHSTPSGVLSLVCPESEFSPLPVMPTSILSTASNGSSASSLSQGSQIPTTADIYTGKAQHAFSPAPQTREVATQTPQQWMQHLHPVPSKGGQYHTVRRRIRASKSLDAVFLRPRVDEEDRMELVDFDAGGGGDGVSHNLQYKVTEYTQHTAPSPMNHIYRSSPSREEPENDSTAMSAQFTDLTTTQSPVRSSPGPAQPISTVSTAIPATSSPTQLRSFPTTAQHDQQQQGTVPPGHELGVRVRRKKDSSEREPDATPSTPPTLHKPRIPDNAQPDTTPSTSFPVTAKPGYIAAVQPGQAGYRPSVMMPMDANTEPGQKSSAPMGPVYPAAEEGRTHETPGSPAQRLVLHQTGTPSCTEPPSAPALHSRPPLTTSTQGRRVSLSSSSSPALLMLSHAKTPGSAHSIFLYNAFVY